MPHMRQRLLLFVGLACLSVGQCASRLQGELDLRTPRSLLILMTRVLTNAHSCCCCNHNTCICHAAEAVHQAADSSPGVMAAYLGWDYWGQHELPPQVPPAGDGSSQHPLDMQHRTIVFTTKAQIYHKR